MSELKIILESVQKSYGTAQLSAYLDGAIILPLTYPAHARTTFNAVINHVNPSGSIPILNTPTQNDSIRARELWNSFYIFASDMREQGKISEYRYSELIMLWGEFWK